MIQVPAVIERCAGIDIGKREIATAVITGPADEEGEVKTRAYGTSVPALEQLRDWLIEEGCTSVAMESTGSYWIPVKNILEEHFQIVLVCPRNHHPKRGDKTDFRDAHNLAHLHRHGLLRGERSERNAERSAYRWGSEAGFCVIDGQRVRIERPRVRSRALKQEIPLGSYETFERASLMDEAVWQKIMHGLTMRSYKEVVQQF